MLSAHTIIINLRAAFSSDEHKGRPSRSRWQYPDFARTCRAAERRKAAGGITAGADMAPAPSLVTACDAALDLAVDGRRRWVLVVTLQAVAAAGYCFRQWAPG